MGKQETTESIMLNHSLEELDMFLDMTIEGMQGMPDSEKGAIEALQDLKTLLNVFKQCSREMMMPKPLGNGKVS